MSMHRKPLTKIEEEGLRAHGLAIGTPSQLSDVFRQGITWAKSQQAPSAVPEGWQLVPIEPTEVMLRQMEQQWMVGSQIDMAKREYKAMLAASPEPTK